MERERERGKKIGNGSESEVKTMRWVLGIYQATIASKER